MSFGWYVGLGSTGGRSLIRAISSSAGSTDADKIPRLNVDGKIDPTMLPSSVLNTIEARTAANTVLGDASILREGTNISFSFSSGILTISSLVNPVASIFDPVPDFLVFTSVRSWTP